MEIGRRTSGRKQVCRSGLVGTNEHQDGYTCKGVFGGVHFHAPTERAQTSAIALREMGFRDPWRETVINHPRWPLCHAHTLLACRGGEMTYQILQILPFELLQKVRNGLARVILKMSAPCWGCVETMPISTRILQQMRPNVNIIK